MKYSLRSLMIVVLVLPPLIAGAWLAFQYWIDARQPKNDFPEWYDQGDNVW